jgi:predicted GNAT family acetyltransferase
MADPHAPAEPTLRRNTTGHRFELHLGDRLAGFMDYRERGDALHLVHTEMLPEFEGQGLAARLAEFALGEARDQGRKVVPTCSYVARYLQRHPQHADLVAG